ncbi:bola-like protein [Xylariomycetidae sp. FL2044]|nr:bola-like protein [Xylariomycetidae sp. FL2044]
MICARCRHLAAAAIPRSRPASPSLRIGQRWGSALALKATTTRVSSRSVIYPSRTAFTSKNYSTSPNSAATAAASATSASTPPTEEAPAVPEKPDYLNKDESAIWDKLSAEFSPTELTVQDISGGCGSMYGIEVASEKFRGVTMLKQQRMVNAVLGDEMKMWHGVQLRTRVP